MAWISQRKLLKTIDDDLVRGAIRAAEQRTSGEIRVSLSRFFWGPIEPVARRSFKRMKMEGTKDRNGILFFVVPSRRRFFVLGDEGIHAKVGLDFWTALAAAMSGRFKKGEFTEGLVEGIDACGERLAAHFPNAGPEDVNELPDEIDVR
ncbi:MAG: TPM domain-containing protein [Acidobacteriota bacterium]|nr:TPM domain-containing protein [Acidobacteriota bacterium]